MDQISQWFNRQRTKARRTVVGDLPQTHAFLEGDNPIDTSVSFPSQARDLTVDLEVTVTATTIAGVVFELGGGTGGFSIVLDEEEIFLYVGETGDDGAIASGANFPNVVGAKVKVTAACRPGTGEAWVWVNGKIAGRAVSVNGALSNGWGTNEDGAVADVTGTAHPDIPAPQEVTLVGGTVNGQVRVYDGQIPHNLSS